MKTVVFVGEIRDFSDQWLLSWLGDYFKIGVVDIGQDKFSVPKKEIDLVINRLYASAIARYGNAKVFGVLSLIEQLTTPIINSVAGYKLEINRLEQYQFFRSNKLPYIHTFKPDDDRIKEYNACVVKRNTSGRNKELVILRQPLPFQLNLRQRNEDIVLQPLIAEKICYRTEFVGKWSATFPQYLDVQKNQLTFSRGDYIPTPLSQSFLNIISQVMNNIGVQAFSIEYFLLDEEECIIIDFNCTSNYSPLFIKQVGDQLKNAWLEVIENVVSARNTFIS